MSFKRLISGKSRLWIILGALSLLFSLLIVYYLFKPSSKSVTGDPEAVVLTVTPEGYALVAPDHILITPMQVVEYMQRRSLEIIARAPKNENHIFLTAIIYADGDTPFIRDPQSHQSCVYDIIRACRFAGYDYIRLGIRPTTEVKDSSQYTVQWITPFHHSGHEIRVEIQKNEAINSADKILVRNSLKPDKIPEPLLFGSKTFHSSLQTQLTEIRGDCATLSIKVYANIKYIKVYQIFEVATLSGFDRFQQFLVHDPVR